MTPKIIADVFLNPSNNGICLDISISCPYKNAAHAIHPISKYFNILCLISSLPNKAQYNVPFLIQRFKQ